MIALFLHYIYRMNFPTVFIFYMNIDVAVGSEFIQFMYYLVHVIIILLILFQLLLL